jgi:hypothetical protein
MYQNQICTPKFYLLHVGRAFNFLGKNALAEKHAATSTDLGGNMRVCSSCTPHACADEVDRRYIHA